MKSAVVIVAVLTLGAGAAFAATPGDSAMSQPAQQQQMQTMPHRDRTAMVERSSWRGNQETEALNLLEAQGFANFTDFRAMGHDQYAANVRQHGRNYTVSINPQDGQITRG